VRLLTLRVFSLQFYSQPVFIPSHFKNLLDLSKLLEKFTYTRLKQLVILFCKFSDFKKPYKCMASEWNSLLLRAIVFEFYSKLYIRPFLCVFFCITQEWICNDLLKYENCWKLFVHDFVGLLCAIHVHRYAEFWILWIILNTCNGTVDPTGLFTHLPSLLRHVPS